MALSRIQRRHQAERDRIALFEVSLRKTFPPQPRQDLDAALTAAQAGLGSFALRDPALWRPQVKTRDPGRLTLAAARYLYARYAVPGHLEAIWLDQRGLDRETVAYRKRCYVVAAQGGSLYREQLVGWLSRRETHAFLQAPAGLGFEGAFWHAVARSYTQDRGTAKRVALSRITRMPLAQIAFWREAARFFCVHPLPRNEMDDLCDYIGARRNGDAAYSLKGRTPASLRRQMLEWHRDLALVRAVGGLRWEGSRLADWLHDTPAGPSGTPGDRLMMLQLRTGAELVAEGRAMHHCVATYQGACAEGGSSIWSLRRRKGNGLERLLTIEVSDCGEVLQVRGFANRDPSPEEWQIVRCWMRDNRLRGR